MKILFCIGSLEKGGAERVVSNLANSFVLNNEVSIVTTIGQIQYEINNKIKLYSLDSSKLNKKRLNRIVKVKKLYSIIREVRPDVIVSFLREPTFRVLLLRKFIKTPIIVSVRNDPKIEYKDLKNRIIMKLLYPNADGFVFQTEEAKEYFSKRIKNKSTIIPNPIKKEFIERKLYMGKRDKTIVSVGRLEEQKNHELLIEAFYNINKEIRDYKLIIYGEGTLRGILEDKIKKYGMEDRILLPGVVDNIPERIERAKLFVLSSDFEGMPNALMEAMALGLPCISTNCPCGGPKFLIKNNENGFLVKVGDKNDLKNKIKELINKNNDELTIISKNAKERTRDLAEEKINEKWYEFIYKISKGKYLKS